MKTFQPWSPGRLIAVDHGTRSVKLLLLEGDVTSLRVLDHKLVDLQEEGLLASEETQRHLSGLLEAWGHWPIAITLPAPLSFAQVLDLPTGGEQDIPKVIEEQTGRLRGFSNSPLVYDAVALTPHAKLQKPYFITIAREEDVDQHIKRVTTAVNEVRDVSSFASALVSAHQALEPGMRNGLLVDFGASSTVVVAVRDGQGVFASSFASGSNAFADTLASARKIPAPEAEARLRAQNLFAGAVSEPSLVAVAENWLDQLKKMLDDWRKQQSDWLPPGQAVPVTLSGGALRLLGLLEHLQGRSGFTFARWPSLPKPEDALRLSDFAAAYGTALEALRRPRETPSLLPPLLRAHRRSLEQMAGVNVACVISLIVAALLLAGATWHKASLLVRKRALARQAEAALVQMRQLETLAQQRDQAFVRHWPLLDCQERTLDLLHTLRVLQRSRADHDFWCVLIADSDSYSRGMTLPAVVTNRFGQTNAFSLPEESYTKPSFVIELCVPAQGDQTLKTVGDLVSDLRKDPLFSRVDSLPVAQRRALVDPKVLIPDRHFAVSVDLADLGWRGLFQTVRLAEPLVGGTNALRRPSAWPLPRARTTPMIPPYYGPPAFARPDA